MKLLSKADVLVKTNSQKKDSIDEGVMIARKIDALRETLAKEEKNLSSFRETVVNQVKKDAEEWVELAKQKKKEVEDSEQKRVRLLAPLDAEWKVLRAEQELHKSNLANLDQKELDFAKKSNELNTKIKELDISLKRVEERQAQVDKSFQEAETIRATTKRESEDRLKAVSNREEKVAQKEKAIAGRERLLEYDKQHYKDFEANLLTKERDLALRERRLKFKERNADN